MGRGKEIGNSGGQKGEGTVGRDEGEKEGGRGRKEERELAPKCIYVLLFIIHLEKYPLSPIYVYKLYYFLKTSSLIFSSPLPPY